MSSICELYFASLQPAFFQMESFARRTNRCCKLCPELHDAGSKNAIWRWVQRAHFHASGIGAFSLGLILVVALSTMKAQWKRAAAVLIGLDELYPLSWFTMFWLAPSLGRKAAHQHWLVDTLTYIGVGGLLLGLALLLANLFLHAFAEPPAA